MQCSHAGALTERLSQVDQVGRFQGHFLAILPGTSRQLFSANINQCALKELRGTKRLVRQDCRKGSRMILTNESGSYARLI